MTARTLHVGGCKQCGDEIDEKRLRKGAKFCSYTCQKAWWGKGAENDFAASRVDLPSGTVGALAELAVSVDLVARGFEVFRALSPASSCDLAVLTDKRRLLRVEVRTAYLRGGEPYLNVAKKDPGRQDFYALVIHTSPRQIFYVWPDGSTVNWETLA